MCKIYETSKFYDECSLHVEGLAVRLKVVGMFNDEQLFRKQFKYIVLSA